MHVLIGAALLFGGLGLWYVRGRLRFNRSNGLAAPKCRSFHHQLLATTVDRVLSFASKALVVIGAILVI